MSNETLMRWKRIESFVGGFDLRPCGFEAEMEQEVVGGVFRRPLRKVRKRNFAVSRS